MQFKWCDKTKSTQDNQYCKQKNTKKYSCSLSSCMPPYANGGVCNALQKCSCPAGFSGVDSPETTCNKKCKNGGVCNQNKTCIYEQGFTGDSCDQR